MKNTEKIFSRAKSCYFKNTLFTASRCLIFVDSTGFIPVSFISGKSFSLKMVLPLLKNKKNELLSDLMEEPITLKKSWKTLNAVWASQPGYGRTLYQPLKYAATDSVPEV